MQTGRSYIDDESLTHCPVAYSFYIASDSPFLQSAWLMARHQLRNHSNKIVELAKYGKPRTLKQVNTHNNIESST